MITCVVLYLIHSIENSSNETVSIKSAGYSEIPSIVLLVTTAREVVNSVNVDVIVDESLAKATCKISTLKFRKYTHHYTGYLFH